MANYIELSTGRYPVSQSQIRAENPNTSYPATFPTPEGYAVVFPAPAPSFDPIAQIVREIAPALTNKGHYEQAYEVVDLDVETIAANQEAKRIAAIPSSVSPRQIRQALTAANLRTQVEAAVAAADQDTKDWYEFATIFERQHPMVIALASSLSVTERQLDDLFTLAGSL